MKRSVILATAFALFINSGILSQVVTTTPAIPIDNLPVTLVFDATQGDKGLMGYTGDVYAHMGVLTDSSTDASNWRYVMAKWEINLPECKFVRIAPDRYELTMSPSIRAFFGVPDGEKILNMAFVFRSPDGSETGRATGGGDIFVPVYSEGLTVSILQPTAFPHIVSLNDSFLVEIMAKEADTIALYLDNQLMAKDTNDKLTDTLVADRFGKFLVRAVAVNDTGSVADSFYTIVRKPALVQDLPDGIRDGINYLDTATVVLSLLAPGKEFVYLLGDFNDWEVDSSYQMHSTPDGKRYWLEVGGLTNGGEYLFQYLVDGKLRIADPYADKIIDPANDPYIGEETYPGLIPYPAGKTTGIASVLQTGQVPYIWQVQDFSPVPPEELVIYEILVRDFTEKHTFQAIVDTLGYLQRLGVNAIELMPVNEFEGNVGWGYNPSFYFAPDKYYGPKNDLKKLIDECHKRDIAVIMDMVLNHAYDQCPFVQLYFENQKPGAENPWFNVDHNFENPDAQWGNDFNHESPYTQQLVDSINSYWMSEYRFDGFRFDFTKGFGNNKKDDTTNSWGSNYDADRIRLLKRMSDEIWKRNEDAIIIMEHLAVNQEDEELADHGILLWGNMNYNYCEAAMGWNEGSKTDFSGVSYKNRGWDQPRLVGYMESHDEQRLMYKCLRWGNGSGAYRIQDTTTALRRMALNAVFFLTVPGPKMIWQFGERGYDISIDSMGRLGEKPPRWEYMSDPRRSWLVHFYSALTGLRKSHEVFRTADFTLNVGGSLKRIILRDDEMNTVILGNFGVTAGNISGQFPHTGRWYDYFSGDSLEIGDVNDLISLEAGEYHLFTDARLRVPDLGTALADHPGKEDSGYLLVYPNPASDYITVSGYSGDRALPDICAVEICDLSGRTMLEKDFISASGPLYMDISFLPGGFYLLVLKEKGKSLARKKIVVTE